VKAPLGAENYKVPVRVPRGDVDFSPPRKNPLGIFASLVLRLRRRTPWPFGKNTPHSGTPAGTLYIICPKEPFE